jgi:hypothetical protein
MESVEGIATGNPDPMATASPALTSCAARRAMLVGSNFAPGIVDFSVDFFGVWLGP